MFDPKDDETKKEVIAMLLKLKLPRLREYSVCVTLNEPVIMFLTKNGFVHSGSVKSGFLKLEVKK